MKRSKQCKFFLILIIFELLIFIFYFIFLFPNIHLFIKSRFLMKSTLDFVLVSKINLLFLRGLLHVGNKFRNLDFVSICHAFLRDILRFPKMLKSLDFLRKKDFLRNKVLWTIFYCVTQRREFFIF